MRNAIISGLGILLFASFFYINVSAQSENENGKPLMMVGDKDATWILTDNEELIYCWWPESPNTRGKQARCRVLNRYRVEIN
jgi:hypothetical protein